MDRILGRSGWGSWAMRCVAALAGGFLVAMVCASVASADLSGTQLSLFAGTGAYGSPTPGPATTSKLAEPNGVAVDPSTGDLYIADTVNNEIERVTPAGILSIIAGNGQFGAPTPGPATSSKLAQPAGVAVDPRTGDVYIADSSNSDVERVTPAGILSIIAGSGSGGPPTPPSSSQIGSPFGVAVNPHNGDVFIADLENNEIERVTPTGILSIIAGTGTIGPVTPGPATSSDLFYPTGVAVNPSNGDLYIAGNGDPEVLRVTRAGILSIIAGTGSLGPATPGPATSSDLGAPTGVAINPCTGDLFIADQYDQEIEQVTSAGILSIIAGTGSRGLPTPGPATLSDLNFPFSVAVKPRGDDLYIADSDNNVVEQVGRATRRCRFPVRHRRSNW